MIIRNALFSSIAGLAFLVSAHVVVAYSIESIPVTPEGDFVLEPGKLEIFLNPGESIIRSISVTNRTGRDLQFDLSAEDFVGSDDPLRPVVLLSNQEESPYSLVNLITPEITSFSLKFGERITIPVTITAPINAEPRGYYGAVVVSNVPTSLAGTSSPVAPVQIVSRIGTLFLVRVNGDVTEAGTLNDFRVAGAKKFFYQQHPDAFEILFKNTGNVHLVPHGIIRVKNVIGSVIDTLPVDAYFALPDATRYRTVLWNTNRFLIGRYTATVEFYPGFGDATEVRTIAFWVLPWKIIGALFGAIIALIALLSLIFSRFEIRRK